MPNNHRQNPILIAALSAIVLVSGILAGWMLAAKGWLPTGGGENHAQAPFADAVNRSTSTPDFPPLRIEASGLPTIPFGDSTKVELTVEEEDGRYFRGKRIWSPYDTPNDLQWDLIGAVVGAALAYALMRLESI